MEQNHFGIQTDNNKMLDTSCMKETSVEFRYVEKIGEELNNLICIESDSKCTSSLVFCSLSHPHMSHKRVIHI